MPTKIEWATEPWNPITGCTSVSEGCQNCYARRMAKRLKGRFGYPADDPFKVTFHLDKLEQPLHWKKPRIIFVCSMSDLFHEDVLHFTYTGNEITINHIYLTIKKCPQHIFLILTKRPEAMRSFFNWIRVGGEDLPKNLWLGISAENQPRFDERVSILLQIPAAKRFVSVEPMLGPMDLRPYIPPRITDAMKEPSARCGHHGNLLHGKFCPDCFPNVIDWVICGGESGPGARPMHPAWPRSVRDQCQEAGVPFFFKQWGEWIGWDDLPEPKSKRFNMLPDNKIYSWTGKDNPDLSPAGRVSYRIGKKMAGRLLDDREWSEYPV